VRTVLAAPNPDLGVIVIELIISSFRSDAHDMYNSPFFDNSSCGVGGWGDPANDYQIFTGGFKDAIRAYPSPHHIRRNFTLYPFQNPNLGKLFPNDPLAPPPPKDFMINSSMTKENINYTINSFEGDFIGLHAYTESLGVS
jgi:tyrosinase